MCNSKIKIRSSHTFPRWVRYFFSPIRIAVWTLFYSIVFVIYLFSCCCCSIYSFIFFFLKGEALQQNFSPDTWSTHSHFAPLGRSTNCLIFLMSDDVANGASATCVPGNCQLQLASPHALRRRSTYANEWWNGPLALFHVRQLTSRPESYKTHFPQPTRAPLVYSFSFSVQQVFSSTVFSSTRKCRGSWNIFSRCALYCWCWPLIAQLQLLL